MTPTEEKTANVSVGDKSAADFDTKSAIEPKMARISRTGTVHMTITRYASTIRFGRSGRCGDMITRL